MAATSNKIDTLLAWCSSNGIKIDPQLEIKHTQNTGIAVFSRDTLAPGSATLVHIPKSAVLSVKSCSSSHLIPTAHHGHGAQLALSCALYIELKKADSSRWFGYLQSLPQEIVDIPLFWTFSTDDRCTTSRQVDDGAEALRWLRGTEAQKKLRCSVEDNTDILEKTREYYYNVVEPLVSELFSSTNPQPSLCGFYHAYSLVSSRAFLVDAYHGLAMVPIADAFNHTQDNHVHLESDFDVCSTCGALQECPHDRYIDNLEDHLVTSAMSSLGTPIHVSRTNDDIGEDLDAFYEMVSNAPILPGSEVFNTYGENLSNAQLLLRYGFVLDANENDHVSWEAGELFRFFDECHLLGGPQSVQVESECMDSLWNELLDSTLGIWTRFAGSRLVYNNPVAQSVSATYGGDSCLCINADGKISHQLWLYCALFICSGFVERIRSRAYEKDGFTELLRQVVELQLDLEDQAEATIDDELDEHWEEYQGTNKPEAGGAQEIGESGTLVAEIGRSVISLCAVREGSSGRESTNDRTLGDILDDLPADRSRTRIALMHLISERSILESCKSNWVEVVNLARPFRAL